MDKLSVTWVVDQLVQCEKTDRYARDWGEGGGVLQALNHAQFISVKFSHMLLV